MLEAFVGITVTAASFASSIRCLAVGKVLQVILIECQNNRYICTSAEVAWMGGGKKQAHHAVGGLWPDCSSMESLRTLVRICVLKL